MAAWCVQGARVRVGRGRGVKNRSCAVGKTWTTCKGTWGRAPQNNLQNVCNVVGFAWTSDYFNNWQCNSCNARVLLETFCNVTPSILKQGSGPCIVECRNDVVALTFKGMTSSTEGKIGNPLVVIPRDVKCAKASDACLIGRPLRNSNVPIACLFVALLSR